MSVQYDCQIDGCRIAYREAGVGKPLLLVHGISTYSFIWRNIIPALSQSYRVIAVDLLGCGDSEKPLDHSYSLKEHARRLSRFIEQLQLQRPHLVGHDLGGGIAQILAAENRPQLGSLALLNSVGHNYWPVQPISILRTPIVRHLLMSITDKKLFRVLVKRGLYHKQKLTGELLELFWRPLETSAGRRAFLHFAKCLDNSDLVEIEADLQQLSLPVLILRGDADPFLSATIAEKLHQDIPGSRLTRIATASHYLMEDEPEWTAAQLLDFFRECDD